MRGRPSGKKPQKDILKKDLSKTWSFKNIDIDYVLEDIIWLKNSKGRGRVCFIGETSFAEGKWVGLELVDVPGEHDGSYMGLRYFRCAKGRGVFVKPSEIDIRDTKRSNEVERLSLQLARSPSLRMLKQEI